MWIFWVIFFTFFISGWRLELHWRNRRAYAGDTITNSSGEDPPSSSASLEFQSATPQNQPHFTHEIEEVIQEEHPDVDPSSSMDPPPPSTSPEFHSTNQQTRNQRVCTIIAGAGGLIVGYMTLVTGGLIGIPNYLVLISRVIYKKKAKAYTDNFCAYRNQLLFLYSSSIHLLAILGLVVSSFCIRWGRRHVLCVSAVLLLLGVTFAAWFPTIEVEVTSLLLAGFGVGLIHRVTRTIYTEAILKDARWLVFDWGVVAGNVLSVVMNYLALDFPIWGYLASDLAVAGWRMSYTLVGLFTNILLILSYFLIESPHHFIEQNHFEMAKTSLRAMGVPDIEAEFSKLRASIANKQSTSALREITTPPNRPALIITTIQKTFLSASGVEIIIFYGPFLLYSVQPPNHLEVLAPLLVVVIQAIGKIVGALCLRWTGRRKAFPAAYLAAIISLVCLAIIFHINPNHHHHLKFNPATISIVMVVLYSFSNGIVLGPYGWIDSAFSEECAQLGSNYGYCVQLLASFVANQLSLHLLCRLREWTFLVYAIYSLMMMSFMLGFIPETVDMKEQSMVRRTLRQHWFWRWHTGTSVV